MPERSIPHTPRPMVEVSYAEGDLVRVIDGEYRGMYGKLQAIKLRKGFRQYHPICLVEIPGIGTFIYLRDELENYGAIDPIGTLKYGYEEWVRGLPPMPAPPDERVESEVGNG